MLMVKIGIKKLSINIVIVFTIDQHTNIQKFTFCTCKYYILTMRLGPANIIAIFLLHFFFFLMLPLSSNIMSRQISLFSVKIFNFPNIFYILFL